MKSKNAIKDKSFAFAVRVVRICQYLVEQKKSMCYQSNFCGVEQVLGPCCGRLNMLSQEVIFPTNWQSLKKKSMNPCIGWSS